MAKKDVTMDVIHKKTVWDIIFFISMGIVLLWIILKSVGIIKTPFWLEYGVPLASLVIGVGSLYTILLEKMNLIMVETAETRIRMNHFEKEMGYQRIKLESVEKEVHVLKKNQFVNPI